MESIKLILISVLVLLMFSTKSRAQQQNKKPNIIFIYADDLGYGDLSSHGNDWIKTPNIDKMANQGMDFTNFTVNSPVCSPSRVAVMTGQFPARQSIHGHFAGVKGNKRRGMPDWMDPDGMSLPREFQKAGYVTGHFGKWHLGSASGMPLEGAYGYDEYATFNGSKTIEVPKGGSVYVDSTEKFIKRYKDEPFFINLWLHETHVPHFPLDKYMEQFKDLDEQKRVYASVVAEADESVGRIINLLQKLGIDDNTLVVFSSDNGPEHETTEKHHGKGLGKYYSIGETGGLKGEKRSLFAGGVRVPFIAKWPKVIPQGKEDTTSVITAVDLVPTFLEAAGIDMAKDYRSDGESFMSALKGQGFERTKPIFWEWRGGYKEAQPYTWPTLGVRDGDWKLVVDVTRDKHKLYNGRNDWKESNDLSEHNPEKVKELIHLLKEWKQSLPEKPRKCCVSKARKKIKK